MKRIVNVNIAAQPFTLDEDAYEALESYLDDIASRLPAADIGSMDNIESRIARLLDTSVAAGRQIVSLRSVEEVKNEIGCPESFGRRRDESPRHAAAEWIEEAETIVEPPSHAEAEQPAAHLQPTAVVVGEVRQPSAERSESAVPVLSEARQEPPYDYPTHLYRSRDERMLAGVCGGLAKYINYPVSTVRTATVILALPALLSVFAYFILWYILPEEPLYDKNGKVIDTGNR